MLLDSSYNEIHALRVDGNGIIYAAAVRGRAGTTGSSQPDSGSDAGAPTPIPSVSTEITAIAIVDSAPVTVAGGSPTPPPARGPGAGAIFRILPDGASDLIWESRDDTPYDMAFEANGALLVATGNKGKIYRLAGDPYQPTLVTRANAEQVTTLGSSLRGRIRSRKCRGRDPRPSPRCARPRATSTRRRRAGAPRRGTAPRWRPSRAHRGTTEGGSRSRWRASGPPSVAGHVASPSSTIASRARISAVSRRSESFHCALDLQQRMHDSDQTVRRAKEAIGGPVELLRQSPSGSRRAISASALSRHASSQRSSPVDSCIARAARSVPG